MPDEADPAALEAKRRKRAELALRGGRSSTILTEGLGERAGLGGSGRLGGGY